MSAPGRQGPPAGRPGHPPAPAPGRRFDTAAAIAATGLRDRGETAEPPAPGRVRADTEVPAPMLRRVASTGLDSLLCVTLIGVPFRRVYELDDSWWPPVILLLGIAAVVLVTVLRARSGRSVFSGVFGLRTVAGEPGGAPGLTPMIRRNLVSVAAFLAAGASMWSAFLDPTGRGRTWQDRASGTRVIDTRWGADPLEKPGAPDPEADGEAGPHHVVVDPARPGRTLPDAFTGTSVARRTRPGVLPNGLDMTPDAGASPRTGVGSPAGPAPVAVIDAAERAAGEETGPAAPVVVVESAPERIVARLVDDTGRGVSLARSALIGRDPAPGPGEEVELLLALDDPDRTVSKTHLRVDVSDQGIRVVDRGSSNGTVACVAGVDQPLEPGVPLGVPIGTVLRLGERTVTVEAP